MWVRVLLSATLFVFIIHSKRKLDYLILYHVCCNNRESLPGDNDDDNDNDTGDMSTFDMQPTDDEVAEIFRKQVT